jgi:hypothetical protein
MRFIILGLVVLFILLPVLLILFAKGRSLKARVVWGVGAFLSVVVPVALVNLLPVLTNNAPQAQQWERFIGVLVSASGIILPWVIFALFLHSKTKADSSGTAT